MPNDAKEYLENQLAEFGIFWDHDKYIEYNDSAFCAAIDGPIDAYARKVAIEELEKLAEYPFFEMRNLDNDERYINAADIRSKIYEAINRLKGDV